MAQRCKPCAHPQRETLDDLLGEPHNLSAVAREFKITRQALWRHREEHLPGQGGEPGDTEQIAETTSSSVKKLPPQEAFLTHFAASADLRASMKEAGIGRVALRHWQEHDEEFSLRFHQAEAEAVENLEAEARIRAVAGSKMIRRVYRHGMLYEEIHEFRPSDAMLVKLLQAAKPEKYGERLTLTQTTVVKAIAEDAWAAV
jgi:hypothetical protein